VRRGEIRSLQSIRAQEQYALIIGSDALNESESTGWVITAPVDTVGYFADLLVTVRITHPIEAIVRLDSVTIVRKARIGELLGRVAPDVMDSVDIALRAALDL
jgi:mRNA-degrading endonuclease toxin of MazEF toxin-antitoxin module